jgi:hypothetical protein
VAEEGKKTGAPETNKNSKTAAPTSTTKAPASKQPSGTTGTTKAPASKEPASTDIKKDKKCKICKGGPGKLLKILKQHFTGTPNRRVSWEDFLGFMKVTEQPSKPLPIFLRNAGEDHKVEVAPFREVLEAEIDRLRSNLGMPMLRQNSPATGSVAQTAPKALREEVDIPANTPSPQTTAETASKALRGGQTPPAANVVAEEGKKTGAPETNKNSKTAAPTSTTKAPASKQPSRR